MAFDLIATNVNNGSNTIADTLGITFVVGSQNITVDQLGIYDVANDGLKQNGVTITIGLSLVTLSGTTITSNSTVASTTIIGSSAGTFGNVVNRGNFAWNSITPVTLTAGATYMIWGGPFASPDNYQNSSFTPYNRTDSGLSSGLLTVNTDGWYGSTANTIPLNHDANTYVAANLRYAAVGTVSYPMLVGIG